MQLDEYAQSLLTEYRWSGNIRQLRNVAEQLSVLEQERKINAATIRTYLPDRGKQLPALIEKQKKESDFSSEREILYKVLFDMKNDLNDLKKLTLDLINNGTSESVQEKNQGLIEKIYGKDTRSSEDAEDAGERHSVDGNPQPLIAEGGAQLDYWRFSGPRSNSARIESCCLQKDDSENRRGPDKQEASAGAGGGGQAACERSEDFSITSRGHGACL